MPAAQAWPTPAFRRRGTLKRTTPLPAVKTEPLKTSSVLPAELMAGDLVKVATPRGIAYWRGLRARGASVASADAAVYGADGKGIYWEAMPAVGGVQS